MAKMVVDTEAMRRTAGEFEQEIGYWHDLVDQIWRAMTDLDAMWDGDANDTFNAMIEEDKPKFTRLEEMMNLYKDAITKGPKAKFLRSSKPAEHIEFYIPNPNNHDLRKE